MPEELIQHVHDQAKHDGRTAGGDFIFEVDRCDHLEDVVHDSVCAPPTKRCQAGPVSLRIMRPVKVASISASSISFGH